MANPQPSPAARRKARHYAMQGLYQWQMSQPEARDILKQFRDEYDMRHVDFDYFEDLLVSVTRQASVIDQGFARFLQGRDLSELDPITLALLRMATYELEQRLDIPYKVVISEAVSLGKKFGATDSHKFINAVLDKVAAQYRQGEASRD